MLGDKYMRIKHRYAIRINDKTRKILDVLEQSKINYRFGVNKIGISFELYEDDRSWKKVRSMMKRYGCSPLTECVYSKEECDNAKWLSVRSRWKWSYPQPERNYEYERITYENEEYCDSCGCGLVQKDCFKVKKSPNWGKRNFLMLNWVYDEIFASDNAIEVLEKSDLKGFSVLDVNIVKNNIIAEDIKQLRIKHILKPCMIIQKDNINKIIDCKKCKQKKLILKGREIYCAEHAFTDINVDVIKSSEVFGEGYICTRLIFVSNRFYKVITENGLDKDLVFEPINLVK